MGAGWGWGLTAGCRLPTCGRGGGWFRVDLYHFFFLLSVRRPEVRPLPSGKVPSHSSSSSRRSFPTSSQVWVRQPSAEHLHMQPASHGGGQCDASNRLGRNRLQLRGCPRTDHSNEAPAPRVLALSLSHALLFSFARLAPAGWLLGSEKMLPWELSGLGRAA